MLEGNWEKYKADYLIGLEYWLGKDKYKELITKIEKLRALKLRKISKDSEFLKTEKYEVKLANGKVITRERLLKNGRSGDAVVIIPYVNDHEVLVNIEPKSFTEFGIGIGFPAGYIEDGEKPIDAASRELLEETGCVPENGYDINYLGRPFYQDTGATSAKIYPFMARNLKRVKQQSLDKDEFVENMTFSERQLLLLEEEGLLNDSNSIVTLKKATIHNYMSYMSEIR